MNSNACVFAVTQIANEFGCEHGELVTRRAGPDIECHSAQAYKKCQQVYEHLKQVGLNEFDYEDDLTQVPHGIWMKIQYGGLQGLQQNLGISAELAAVEDIATVIDSAGQRYQDIDQIPYIDLVAAMQAYKVKRRKSR